ncbi:hypothetical protein HN011_007500 [Eciton burchellii]|nr:hypothetical protein HN011_007500 [Eciton burchellii]
MRVLKQLAIDNGHLFPAAVPIIESSIYVDNTLFGNDNIHKLREARNQLIGLMKGGGFQLRKWATNSLSLMEDIPNSQHELADHLLAKDETLKILGLSCLPQEDIFCFVIAPSVATTSTRHSILSFIAKLYDWDWDGIGMGCQWLLLQRFCSRNCAQGRLGCPNTARIGATLDGLR